MSSVSFFKVSHQIHLLLRFRAMCTLLHITTATFLQWSGHCLTESKLWEPLTKMLSWTKGSKMLLVLQSHIKWSDVEEIDQKHLINISARDTNTEPTSFMVRQFLTIILFPVILDKSLCWNYPIKLRFHLVCYYSATCVIKNFTFWDK